LSGQPVRVFGDGEQTRCFCHVADTVQALLLLLDRPAADNGIFNIGSPSQISINDLAQRVIDLTGSRSAIEHVPYEEAYAPGFEDMRRRVPDIAKIRDLIGWEPRRDLETIIRDVIAEFRHRGSQPG
jgi:UDP-glucose 4-epimerase